MDNIAILLAGIIGSVGSYWISLHLNKGATMGAALMTLLSGLIFPNIPFIDPALGATLAVVSTTGAYAGMISKKNIPNIMEMVIVGVFVGTISILAMTTYAGVGGKLGTMAAISCFVWLGVKKAFKIGAGEKLEEKKV